MHTYEGAWQSWHHVFCKLCRKGWTSFYCYRDGMLFYRNGCKVIRMYYDGKIENAGRNW